MLPGNPNRAKPECTLDSQGNLSHFIPADESSSVQSNTSSLHLAAVVEAEEADPIELSTTTASQQSYNVPLHRLVHLSKPELSTLIFGCIAAAIHGSILPVFGLLFSNMIQTFYEPSENLLKDSKLRIWMFVTLGFVALMASTGRSYLFAIAGSKLIRRVRSISFEKVVHMEIGWFDSGQNSSSAISTKLSADAASIRGLVGDTLALAIMNSTSVILGVAFALQANWQLALLVVALLPLLGFNTWASRGASKRR